jgi:hypothetical protein
LSWITARVVSSLKAPIFLIGTHADQVSTSTVESVRERLASQMLNAYPGIVGFAPVSGRNGKGFAELLPRLMDTLHEKRLIGFTVPPSWLQVISALRLPHVTRSLRVHASMDYCAWSSVQLLAERLGVTENFEQLVTFLNERGLISHMGRDKSNPLRDWVFINPAWILMATKKLVR